MPQSDATRPRRRRRILLIVLAGVILLPALTVLAVIATFDADSAKPRIIAAVRAATGRELVIAGPIRLVPSLHPSIELTDATLSNPPGFSRPRMADLKQLDLQLALLPLLQRRIEIDRLIVSGADILLEMNAQGVGNWRFSPVPAVVSRPAASPFPAADATGSPSPALHIDRIEIQDGQIAYRNAKMAAPMVLAIKSLALTAGAADQPIHLALAATADAAPFTLSGTIGPSGALFGLTDRPLILDLKASAAGTTLSLAGTIADPIRLSGTALRINAAIPDLAALSGLAHTALPALKAISVETNLTDLPGKPGLLNGFMLHDLKLAAPQAQLDGAISVTRGSPPLFQGTVHAARINADALRAAMPAPAGPPAAAASPSSVAVPVLTRTRLIPDQDLRLNLLRAVNADLTVTVGELLQNGVTYRDLAGRIMLDNAALRLDPFTVTIPGGPARLTLVIDATQPVPPVALTVSAPSLALAPLLSAFRLPPYAQGNLWLEANLYGMGSTAHQLAATLDGTMGLSMENAQIDPRLLGEALNSLEVMKNGKAGLTTLRCLAARMDAQNGTGTLRALLLDTEPARLSGSGSLNFGEETLAIRLQTTVRLGATGISAPLDVGGTFLAPKVKIDAAKPAAGGNNPFGVIIGKLGLEQLLPGASGSSCAHDLAVARGETPPPETPVQPQGAPGAKPPKPADLLRQLLR